LDAETIKKPSTRDASETPSVPWRKEKSSVEDDIPPQTDERDPISTSGKKEWICSVHGQEYPIDGERIETAMNGKSRGLFRSQENKERYGIRDEWLPEPCRGSQVSLDHTSVDLDEPPRDPSSGWPMNMFRVFFFLAEETGKKVFCGVWQHPDVSQVVPGLVSKHYIPCTQP
jgi:hypothetical protein